MDLNQISEMIDRVRKLKNEELKGNQHKIDANKNGKVDAHDFKLLRKMKNEEAVMEASGLSIKATDDTYNVVNSKGQTVKQFPKTPKGMEYAKQFIKQNKGNKGLEEAEEISERRSDREIALSDSPRRRSFGYDSHGYSLRPGHDEGKPVRDRNYGSSYSGPSDSAKIYHKVPFAQRDAAKAEGMRWDSGAKKWYHTSSTKSSQSKFEKS